MTVEIISPSISMKVWESVRIEFATPGSVIGNGRTCYQLHYQARYDFLNPQYREVSQRDS